MCKIVNEIENIITNYKNANGQKWHNYDISKLAIKYPISVAIDTRQNITIHTNANLYKLVEYTVWNSENRQCVAIGYNPASGNVNEIDRTNCKLIKALNTTFDEYVLLNLYPQVSPNAETCDKQDTVNIDFQKTLVDILNLLIKDKIPTIIFWGRSVKIDETICEILKRMIDAGILYKTVKKNTTDHFHPSRVAIEVAIVKQGDLSPDSKLL